MQFNLTRLKQLAGMPVISETDAPETDDNVKDAEALAAGAEKSADKANAAPAKAAPPFGKPAEAAEPAEKLDPKTKEHREATLKRASSELLDPKMIKASVKHLVTKAHGLAQAGDKNFGPIKSELQHYHDVCLTNLHGRHGFPFANPAASAEDKQNAGEIFDLSNSLDKIIRTDLGKKPNEIEGIN
jgi:hypothetical protein